MKAQTPTAEVRKILFVENSIVEKRREWRHSGECRGTRKPVIPWVRVRIGFYSFFFCIAWWWRYLSDANGYFLWRRSVSLTTYHLLGPPAVRPSVLHSLLSVVALTAFRDRDDKVYSVTASCWQGAMKGPAASGLTMRAVVKGTAVSRSFSSQPEAFVVWWILGEKKQTWQVRLKCKAQTRE
jgi:hypothetical protein